MFRLNVYTNYKTEKVLCDMLLIIGILLLEFIHTQTHIFDEEKENQT